MSTKTGWCMSADCDTESRGGCPIQVGSTPACDCPCHAGATAPRPYLGERLTTSRAKADKLARELAAETAAAEEAAAA